MKWLDFSHDKFLKIKGYTVPTCITEFNYKNEGVHFLLHVWSPLSKNIGVSNTYYIAMVN